MEQTPSTHAGFKLGGFTSQSGHDDWDVQNGFPALSRAFEIGATSRIVACPHGPQHVVNVISQSPSTRHVDAASVLMGKNSQWVWAANAASGALVSTEATSALASTGDAASIAGVGALASSVSAECTTGGA